MGNVVTAGEGQAPARQAALHAGLPDHIPAVTINKVCGSGLKAVMLAAQAIKAGDGELYVAGGMESMSNAPYLLPKARTGYRMGNGELVDSVVTRRPLVRLRGRPHGRGGRDRRRQVRASRARRRTSSPTRAT